MSAINRELVLPREVLHINDELEPRVATTIYNFLS